MSILSLSLAFSFSVSSPIFARSHVANGVDVVPDGLKWDSFSICTREDGGVWEDAYKALYETNADGTYKLDENGNKIPFTYKVDYWTEGGIPPAYNNDSRNVGYYSVCTGWDGEYSVVDYKTGKSELTGDNPWGMTLSLGSLEKGGIPVEFGRYYTLEFDIGADFHRTGASTPIGKHILFKPYDYKSSGGPSAAIESVTQDGVESSTDGYIYLKPIDSDKKIQYSHIKALFKIPDTKEEWGGGYDSGLYTDVGVMFAMGANLVSYPDDEPASGEMQVKNLKVTAGDQHLVKYFDEDGKSLKSSKYVNDEDSAKPITIPKKGKTLVGFKKAGQSSLYNFSSPVTNDLDLVAVFKTTPKPKKPSLKVKSSKKHKATVTFGADANTQGYEVKYSHNSKFKKKSKYKTKTKTTFSTTTYTIKSLKSESLVYVKARAFNKDSAGNKVFGKWGKRKVAFVR